MYRVFYPALPVQNNLTLTSVASVSVANVSGPGILKSIGVQTSGAAVTGTPSAELRISIDGGSTITIPCWAGATAFDVVLRPLMTRVSSGTNPGGVLGDTARLLFMAEFRSSLIVDFYVTSAGSAGTGRICVEYDTLRD